MFCPRFLYLRLAHGTSDPTYTLTWRRKCERSAKGVPSLMYVVGSIHSFSTECISGTRSLNTWPTYPKSGFALNKANRAPMTVVLEHFGLRQPTPEHFDRFFETCLLSANHWESFTLGKFAFQHRDDLRIRADSRWREIHRNILSVNQISEGLTCQALMKTFLF